MWTDREETIIKMIEDLAGIIDKLIERIEKLEKLGKTPHNIILD